jgi:hypothetical protein
LSNSQWSRGLERMARGRVTRSGEFEPIGWFTLGTIIFNYWTGANFWTIFSNVPVMHLFFIRYWVGKIFWLLFHKLIRSPCPEGSFLKVAKCQQSLVHKLARRELTSRLKVGAYPPL